MLNFYSCMLSQEVIILAQLTEKEKLRYLKTFIKYAFAKSSFSLYTSRKSLKEIESAGGKRAISIIFKGNIDHSLNFQCQKQLI